MADNTNYPKRLIEVDLPIKRISAHARREKSIRHGHISTLHIWWARRPLAACRAVICAALWPDPADPLCPEAFQEKARDLMKRWAKDNLKFASLESFKRFTEIQNNPDKLNDNLQLRTALLDFIADFANWDNSTNKEYLETSRALTQSAHEALGGEPSTRPLVVDPFAGGGSIPLEALRVGADAFASDLNPVAVLLNKVVLEYIPKYGQRLADEVRKWGQWIKDEAERELAEFYPKDTDGATPIAYLWARTIQCEGPGCGAEVPLIRSLLLAKRDKKFVALNLVTKEKNVDLEILEYDKEKELKGGTVQKGSATCPCCFYTTPVTSVRRQLKERKGGTFDARLFAVVTSKLNSQGRSYRIPNAQDHHAVEKAKEYLEALKRDSVSTLSLVPDEAISLEGTYRIIKMIIYGSKQWSDLFSPRQQLTLAILAKLVSTVGQNLAKICDYDFARAIQTCLALAVDRQSDYLSSLTIWSNKGEFIAHTFGRQALPIVWEWPECQPFANGSGNWLGAINWIALVIENLCVDFTSTAQVQECSASNHFLPDNSVECFFTDPPYYDAIAYSALSDFFYVWLKRTVSTLYPSLFKLTETPKKEEIIVDMPHELNSINRDIAFYESNLTKAFSESGRTLKLDGIGTIVFASKTTASWEAILQAVINAGLIITASWPIDTERESRVSAQGQARLASSIHLVCRPRQLGKTNIGDWRDVLQELPKRIREWMPRLASEGVVGADAIFACLGPALEIFSRYSHVEKASGEQIKLKDYLEHVWAAVAKEALNMIFTGADATGFEEDARLTAMWLWTLTAGTNGSNNDAEEESEEAEGEDDEESDSKPAKTTGFILEFDAARKIAQGLGAHLETLSSLVETKGNKARLLPVSERGRYLFGKEEEKAAEKGKKKAKKDEQLAFSFLENDVLGSTAQDGKFQAKPGITVLDRIHQTMLLFSAGRSEALKRFLVEDGVGQDQRFWRLAQALSALYPTGTDEKRWVDGVLARKKGLGF